MTQPEYFQLTEVSKFLKKVATGYERQGRRGAMKAATARQHAEYIDYQLRTNYTTAEPMYSEAAA